MVEQLLMGYVCCEMAVIIGTLESNIMVAMARLHANYRLQTFPV
jgi:hypothetical protein